MKKIFLFLVIAALLSCNKEYSYERRCGVVMKKYNTAGADPRITLCIIHVRYNNNDTAVIVITALEYNNINEGEQYCK